MVNRHGSSTRVAIIVLTLRFQWLSKVGVIVAKCVGRNKLKFEEIFSNSLIIHDYINQSDTLNVIT